MEKDTPPMSGSPYRQVFAEIEQTAKLYPHDMSAYTPSIAYRTYYQYLQQSDLDPGVYVSMAITSGGFARNSELSTNEVITHNNSFGDQIRHLMQDQYGFAPQTILVPSELGKVHEWSQADYLMFWFHTISGIQPATAYSIEKIMRNDGVFSPGKYASIPMNTAQGEERAAAYTTFAEAYVSALKENVSPFGKLFNMRAMLGMLDTDMSLGARAESILAETIGIPYYQLFSSEESLPETVLHTVKILQNLGSTSIHLVDKDASSFAGAVRQSSSFPFLRSTGLFKTQEIYDAKRNAPRYRIAY